MKDNTPILHLSCLDSLKLLLELTYTTICH